MAGSFVHSLSVIQGIISYGEHESRLSDADSGSQIKLEEALTMIESITAMVHSDRDHVL